MDKQLQDIVKRLLIRLEDARIEVRNLSRKTEYPQTAKVERAEESIESAEKYLKDLIG